MSKIVHAVVNHYDIDVTLDNGVQINIVPNEGYIHVHLSHINSSVPIKVID